MRTEPAQGQPDPRAAHLPVLCVLCPLPYQAYAMMLSLSEDAALHAPSQSPLDAWMNSTGATPESGAFNPVSHL